MSGGRAKASRSWPSRLGVLALGVVVGAGIGTVTLRALAIGTLPAFGTASASQSAEGAETDESSQRRGRSARPTRVRRPATLPEEFPPLVSRRAWPVEPESPSHVDARRFADAMELLCRERGDSGVVRDVLAPALLEQALAFGADPFLIAALVSRRACRDRPDGGYTGLAPEIYADSITNGRYRFAAYEDDRFSMTTLDVSAFRLDEATLRTPRGHFYFAAAFLHAWSRQDRGLDVAFPQEPHRHYVSHYLWGDRVGSARQESWVLIERRRILEYYDAIEPMSPIEFRGVTISSPLDGAPRLVVSGLGEPRGNGTRPHRGVDFESSSGEPVRAIADGTVIFAGVDLPGSAHRIIDPDMQAEVDLEEAGHGGFYICVEHRPDPERVRSCYMHLRELMIRQGRVVRRGEEIGQVGSTGSSSMGPHLHFEIHVREGVLPATEVLRGISIGRTRSEFTAAPGTPPP